MFEFLKTDWLKSKPKIIKFISESAEIFEAGKSLRVTEKYNFHSITIQADSKNVGVIFIGGIGVNTNNSMILEPGDAMSIDVGKDFIDDIFATSSKSGSKIQFFGTGDIRQ